MEDMNDRWAKKRGLDVDALAEVPGQVSEKTVDMDSDASHKLKTVNLLSFLPLRLTRSCVTWGWVIRRRMTSMTVAMLEGDRVLL